MALDRLKDTLGQLTSKVGGLTTEDTYHPLDPLSESEIAIAVDIVLKKQSDLIFNSVTLLEPKKELLKKYVESRDTDVPRIADVIASGKGNKTYDVLVDIGEKTIIRWDEPKGVYPGITMEDLMVVEEIMRKDPKVIEQCGILGIPAEDMHKVYCDPWTIGYDERYTDGSRLQQALMYYRPSIDDLQYTYPLDFCPIFNIETQEIIHIDIPEKRRPLNKAPPTNFDHESIQREVGLRDDLKPIHITQPEGVSFKLDGRTIDWQKWNFHIGFNYREGIVLSNVTFNDRGNVRPVFWRISLAEMVVPYGNPDHPHHRKHAFDLGEYGAGYMTNPLSMGCDCKGSIQYLDASFVRKNGEPYTIKNAICIHEEDNGILFKHTDFRDESSTTTRARKLIISQIFTAGNYEYCIYWIMHQDGVIQLEVKLTGILSTYALAEGESAAPYGTEVYPGVNAHHHQHLFCLRLDPSIDGHANTVFEVDAVASDAPVGSKENRYGNAFMARKTPLKTQATGISDYNPCRTWDIANTNKLNPHSKNPVSYKLVSREVPGLMPKEGSLVWDRAGFARHAVHVTRYADEEKFPAGRHVPQNSGRPSQGLPAWIAADENASIENEDIVLWHTFGVTHFPSPEDYPIMPAEPMSVLLRPRNFFTQNPCMDVPPSFSSTPSGVRDGRKPYRS